MKVVSAEQVAGIMLACGAIEHGEEIEQTASFMVATSQSMALNAWSAFA
jgi:hypothetical protein